jgi:anthranilate synthase/aminodeoxychorismate synthase-like glutamine amidotransferase
MILFIDNYDSFVYNLVHYVQVIGSGVHVVRNDAITLADIGALSPEAIIISPGPCSPKDAGISVPLVRYAAENNIPLLGVCLGHQALGEAFGAQIIRAPKPMHGKQSQIGHTDCALFSHIPSPYTVARYHSLVVDHAPQGLLVTARSVDDDLIMAMRHESLPLYGVQFHPESIASDYGYQLLSNFLSLARGQVPQVFPEPYPRPSIGKTAMAV